MHQQTSLTSHFSYRPLQLRERGNGEEESELALAPLVSQLVTQSLEVLEVGLIGDVRCLCVMLCCAGVCCVMLRYVVVCCDVL